MFAAGNGYVHIITMMIGSIFIILGFGNLLNDMHFRIDVVTFLNNDAHINVGMNAFVGLFVLAAIIIVILLMLVIVLVYVLVNLLLLVLLLLPPPAHTAGGARSRRLAGGYQ